ncbi:MAG: dephospho-CoA kinase [Bacteroidetes bacterium]|nr:dephospho-CoA kinase [Bacteroidota bacterium]
MIKKGKIKIAVTGSIGSGKSAFCSYLNEIGIPIINVDNESKKLLETDKEIKENIIKSFGKESFVNGKPNKLFIAEKVFSNPQNVQKINSIVHPKVIKKVNILAEEILQNNDIVAAEAALIFEANMENLFDYVVLVTATEKIRMNRKTQSDNLSREQFLKRNDNQIPDIEKMKRADFVFENNDGIDDLKNKALLLINILKGLLTTNA